LRVHAGNVKVHLALIPIISECATNSFPIIQANVQAWLYLFLILIPFAILI
jgi:hypothetical protein